MEATGLSLFQGPETLKLDTSLNQQEEDEADEDQKRRNLELQNLLTNAFDDLLDDDDDDDLSTLNSSHHTNTRNRGDTSRSANNMNYQTPSSPNNNNNKEEQYSFLEGAGDSTEVSAHYRHCYRTSPYVDNQHYRQAEYGSMEQLEVLYEVRVREVHRLTQQIEELKEQAAKEKDQLYRRFALSEAEKERVSLQFIETNKLLATSKGKISDLEKEVETLKFNLENVEQRNLKITGELDAARLAVKDLEQKVSLLERGNVSNTDTFLRGVQERHEKELHNLRNQIESVTAKFAAKDSECEGLQKRLAELSRTHETVMIEKTDTINQLMVNLEESQRHCQKLVLNLDNGKVIAEKEQLEKHVQKLTAELDVLRTDLKHYEAVAQFGLLGVEDSDSFRIHQKPSPSNDLNIKLRDELQRCLAGLRLKRDEIKKLKAHIEDRDQVIHKLREQEAAYLAQANGFKEDAANLMAQLEKHQIAHSNTDDVLELKSQISNLKSDLAHIKAERDRLDTELLGVRQASVEEKLKAIDQHSEEYIQWHDKAVARVRQEASEQMQAMSTDFSIRLKEAQKECDEVKQLYIEVCNSKEKLVATLESEQKNNKDLANHLEIETRKLKEAKEELEAAQSKLRELQSLQKLAVTEELKQALDVEREKIQTLEVELEAARERDRRYAATVTKEIEKAKMEALQELQFNSKQTCRSVIDRSTSPVKDGKTKEGEEITRVITDLKAQHHEQLEQVKQESVRCLANELSACEARHRQQLERTEEEYARNLASFRGLIDSKTQEVEVLKQAMLEERDKLRAERENCQVTEELIARTKEVKLLEERLQSCDKEWQARLNAHAEEWQARLVSHQHDVDTERDKMAEAIAGWAEELQTLRKQHQESEMKSLELKNKYEAAKKTARHYKLWADGKEKHVEQEWHRITVAFQNALEALYEKANIALSSTENDNTVAKDLEMQIQELRDKLSHYTSR